MTEDRATICPETCKLKCPVKAMSKKGKEVPSFNELTKYLIYKCDACNSLY
jgi:hypothetical protein